MTARHLTRTLVVAALAGMAACKGSTEYKDTPETLSKIDNCQRAGSEKDKLIKDYEAQIARLQTQGAGGGEVTLNMIDDVLKVTAKTGGGASIDDATAAAMSGQFIDLVQKSKPAIQRCYVQALKNNPNIQARSIKLLVAATFSASGSYTRSSFRPSLGDTFDACMSGIASKWKLPAASASMSFQAPVSLNPS